MKVLLIALLAVTPVLADDLKLTELIVQADTEEREHHPRAALPPLDEAEKLAPENPGILLRLSRIYMELADQAHALENAQRCLEYAQRALQKDPECAKAHLGVAVGYGKLTDFVNSKTKIEYSKVVRDEAEKSIQLDPTDDYAWYLLGRWNYEVTNVSPMLKVIAKLVYGGIPSASHEEAVRYYKKAIELAPQRLMHHSGLARAYAALGKTDLAAREWRIVLTLPPSSREEEEDHAEAEKFLKSHAEIQPPSQHPEPELAAARPSK